MEHFLSWVFHVWACTYFFLLHCNLHPHRVLQTKWCSFHYVCIMWKEMIEKINEPKKKRCIIFLNVLPMVFFGQFFFWYGILLSFVHHIIIYNMSHMISTHLYLCKHFKMKWIFIFQNKRKKPKHLTPTYLSNYLNKMNKRKNNLTLQ
jgi:hypothetical protein